jgi:hypothetical protein
MQRHKLKINLATLAILFFLATLPACKAGDSSPPVEIGKQQENPEVFPKPRPAPASAGDEDSYFEVEYYNRGSSLTTHIPPILRSTREGDYLICKKKSGKNYVKPMLGLRVFFNSEHDALNPVVADDTFVAIADGKILRPTIQHYQGDNNRLADIAWTLDPDWKVIRINQKIFGLVDEKPFKTQADFWLDIQDGDIEWERSPKPPPLEIIGEPYCLAQYFYRGESPTTYIPSFERCTRLGDYIVLKKESPTRYSKPVLGIRVYRNNEKQLQITNESFTVFQDGKQLRVRIRQLTDDPVWLAEMTWEFDPDWKNARIDQNIHESLDGKLVKSDARFKLDIQDGRINWDKKPPDSNAGVASKDFEICPP